MGRIITILSFIIGIAFILFLLLSIIVIMYSGLRNDRQIYWSRHDFHASGAVAIQERFDEDFNLLFNDNTDIGSIIESANNILFLKERQAELIRVSFHVWHCNNDIIFSNIELRYYVPYKAIGLPAGIITILIFMPNDEIKFVVKGTFSQSSKPEDIYSIPLSDRDEVIAGARLDMQIDNILVQSMIRNRFEENLKEDGYPNEERLFTSERISYLVTINHNNKTSMGKKHREFLRRPLHYKPICICQETN